MSGKASIESQQRTQTAPDATMNSMTMKARATGGSILMSNANTTAATSFKPPGSPIKSAAFSTGFSMGEVMIHHHKRNK